MTSILSAISGQFSKSLFLGTFFPTVLFVILGVILVEPLFPEGWPLLKPLESLSTEWEVVFLSFLTLVLSGLLYNLNIPIIRLYEGYPWRYSWVGQRFTDSEIVRFEAAKARRAGIPELIEYLKRDSGTNTEDIPAVESMRPMIGQQVTYQFPDKESSILPTQLGNVIRSFESYPQRQYKMSSIALWPRLVAKIDKDYAAAIDDAKTSFDFMVNSSVLSAVLALVILTTGLSNPSSLDSRGDWLWWSVELLVFLSLAYLLYRWSIGRASAWGGMVKGAFDLYRWDLLKQLGYTLVPQTVAEEQDLWHGISRQMIYGYPPKDKGRPVDYAAASTFARCEPPGANLEVGRGTSQPSTDGAIRVSVRVKNTDADCVVSNLVVTDTVSDGFTYLSDSAYVDAQKVPVSGTNPYHFEILRCGLAPNRELLLTYTAIPRKA